MIKPQAITGIALINLMMIAGSPMRKEETEPIEATDSETEVRPPK